MKKNEFQKRVQEALVECGVNEQEAEQCASNFPYLLGLSDQFKSKSSFFNFKEKVKLSSQLLDVDEEIFIKAALKQPPLFSLKPETINGNIEQSTKLI